MEPDRTALYVWLGGILPTAIASFIVLVYAESKQPSGEDPAMIPFAAVMCGALWPLVLTGVVGFGIYTLSSIWTPKLLEWFKARSAVSAEFDKWLGPVREEDKEC
jgi:hypothetical protein